VLSLHSFVFMLNFLPVIGVIAAISWLLILIGMVISIVQIAISTVRLWRMTRWLVVNKRMLADRDSRFMEKSAQESARMAAGAPLPIPQTEVDEALYDSVIEYNDRDTAQDRPPTSTPKDMKTGNESHIEKKGENPYALEDDDGRAAFPIIARICLSKAGLPGGGRRGILFF